MFYHTTKFNTFELFILILSVFAIINQTVCCYNVTTSETVYIKMIKYKDKVSRTVELFNMKNQAKLDLTFKGI